MTSNIFQCDKCTQGFKNNRGLNVHKRKHMKSHIPIPSSKHETQKLTDRKRKKVFHCDKCENNFTQQNSLVKHKTMMHISITHERKVQEISSPNSSPPLKKERRSLLVPGADVDAKECDMCNITCKDDMTLDTHIKRHHQFKDNIQRTPGFALTKKDSVTGTESIVCAEEEGDHEKVDENIEEEAETQNLITIKETVEVGTNTDEIDGCLSDTGNSDSDSPNDISKLMEENHSLVTRISELELIVEKVTKEKEFEKEEKEKFKEKLLKLEVKPNSIKIPSHLKSVHKNHIPHLKGYQMRYCATSDGACLTNCATVHVSYTEDKSERMKTNRMINHHIADHWDNYYQDKIGLPYTETVGVGKHRRQVTCNTKEEMIQHLRSEESLCTFGNFQEVQAIANQLNINVKIFKYGIGGDTNKCDWLEVNPDPTMAKHAQFPLGTIPDMALYNEDEVHYDLLVEDDSRLALIGLISSNPSTDPVKVDINEWTEVKGNKSNKTPKDVPPKPWRAWQETDECIQNVRCEGNCDHGCNPTPKKPAALQFICDQCSQHFICKDTLTEHQTRIHIPPPMPMEIADETEMPQQVSKQTCDVCGFTRKTQSQMNKHMKTHGEFVEDDRTHICNRCSLQCLNRDQLKEHIERSHKLEHSCNNCNMTFTSRNDLNKHIVENHKSFKPCRNFANNTCEFDEDCRFNHIIPADNEHYCYKCETKETSKTLLMKHIKETHGGEPCKRFKEGRCSFGSRCIFSHTSTPAPSVMRSSTKTGPEAPLTNSYQDFPILPAAGHQLLTVGGQNYKEMSNMKSMMTLMLAQLDRLMSQVGLTPQ